MSSTLEQTLEEPPNPFTANPFLLFIDDVILFFGISLSFPGLLGIVLPLRPCASGKLDELATSWRNAISVLIHVFLFLAQFAITIAAIVSPFLFVVPAPVYFGVLLISLRLNGWICEVLFHGMPGQKFHAGKQYARNSNEPGDKWVSIDHPEERWVFMNGVGVGTHWMKSNLTLLSEIFRRPIQGIYNPTYGIIFDVFETIIQRSYGYPTLDIRRAYATISKLLRDSEVKKVMLVAHSQGSVEAGMVLDWLYGTLDRDEVAKLEVYTFGNVANHWNCPKDRSNQRAIQHVEHYVNRHEWVGRFGVIHSRGLGSVMKTGLLGRVGAVLGLVFIGERLQRSSRQNRFVGTVFIRNASGHLFNQHYLANLFPMKQTADGRLEVDDDAEYMNKEADTDVFAKEEAIVPRDDTAEDSPNQVLLGTEKESTWAVGDFKIREKSRLWEYRNGNTPLL